MYIGRKSNRVYSENHSEHLFDALKGVATWPYQINGIASELNVKSYLVDQEIELPKYLEGFIAIPEFLILKLVGGIDFSSFWTWTRVLQF